MVKDLWLLTILVVRVELWKHRNRIVCEGAEGLYLQFSRRLIVANLFQSKHRAVKNSEPFPCYYEAPDMNEIVICCDGSAVEYPGPAGLGVVARDADSLVLGAVCMGPGLSTNFMAEVMGILYGLEWASKFGYKTIKIRADSKGAMQALDQYLGLSLVGGRQ